MNELHNSFPRQVAILQGNFITAQKENYEDPKILLLLPFAQD